MARSWRATANAGSARASGTTWRNADDAPCPTVRPDNDGEPGDVRASSSRGFIARTLGCGGSARDELEDLTVRFVCEEDGAGGADADIADAGAALGEDALFTDDAIVLDREAREVPAAEGADEEAAAP